MDTNAPLASLPLEGDTKAILTRAKNALLEQGVETFGQLLELAAVDGRPGTYSKKALLDLPNMGHRSADVIMAFIRAHAPEPKVCPCCGQPIP